ncbi:MAG TPA: sulfatase, partial [Thermogutta sp.]|nr:sulfatase [Thermogutta sp.]
MRVFMSRWSGSTALLGLVGIGLSLLHGSTGWASEVNRPNFLVIIADDMACEDCGAYGHPHIKTPNIDQLAREGMLFERAFLTCSSCSPSRTSLLTGRYPHATGAAELHQPVPPDQLLVTTPLREAGYFTAAAGKWHLGPHVKSQFDVVREGGGDGAYDYWLPVLKERPKDKPFFIWLATTDPHRPYGPNRIPEPHTPQDVIVPPYLPDVPEVREDLALYYDEIGRLDTWVGRIREELIAQGVWDQTMVVFLSDNGRPFPRCKTTVLDSGVRTPLI